MKILLLLLLSGVSALAQNVSADVHDPAAQLPDTAITSTYSFASTAMGSGTSVVVRLRDTAGYPVEVINVLVADSAASFTMSPHFSLTGAVVDKMLSTSTASFEDLTLSFNPMVQGAVSGYLKVTYLIQENGCSLTASDATACASHTDTLSTLQGTGLAPTLVLSYSLAGASTLLSPNSATPLDFGNVSTSATRAFTFTLTNQSTTTQNTPGVSLVTQQFDSAAFSLNTSAMPAIISAGATATFVITFAPGQTGLALATLQVGTLPFPLRGTGVIVADIDALQISYADTTGVRISPQAATPISFGQAVAGTGSSTPLAFTVVNPTTSWNAVSLATLAASGVGFSLSQAPSAPLSIAPGASITFTVVFSPTTKGAYTGTLSIGTRAFSLSGTSISSPLPDATISVDAQPLTSGQQAHVSIQLASASTVDAIGTLTMTFAPSIAKISDDPAILFTATSGRELQITVAAGGQSGTYNSQTAITFQTGTTEGTITFTLAFPDKAPITQSFTIAGAKVSVTGATALRESPNLVLSFAAFDNTYSASTLSFQFYDRAGKAMNASPMLVDGTSAFNQYFFTVSKTGGSFALAANFLVTGDITQVGSVTVQITNSAGTYSVSETFQ